MLYVNDMLVARQDDGEYNRIVNTLKMQFKLTSLGDVNNYLGNRIDKDRMDIFCKIWESGCKTIS